MIIGTFAFLAQYSKKIVCIADSKFYFKEI